MTQGASSLLIDATQLRDLHSGVARRLTSLWPHVAQQNEGIRLGVVAYDFMVKSLRPYFPKIDIHEVRDFGAGPLVRKRHLNPALNQLRRSQGYEWLHQDGFVAAPGKTMVTIHDLRSLDAQYAGWWRRQSARHLLKRLQLSRTPIITVSEFSRKEISKSLGQVDSGIYIVPNGVDAERFQSSKDRANLAELELTPGRFRLFVGHLEKRKNLGFLIEIQRRLVMDDPAATLVVSTHCREKSPDSVSWLSRLGAEPGIIVCNDLNDEQLGGLYRHASCFLMPSLMEGFSITPLEALSLGTPALVSNIGPHQEILGSKFCLPLEVDAWMRGIDEVESELGRQKLILAGAKIVDCLTWERAAEDMSSLLSQL
ncbi:MAG: glycosyltransferase involved in cell wall biosynthesis [Planctomycetota bacterium]|jgi:glycosyltransferase involved in cell wall biosynthesis